jgi:putative effector of murein hydrolase LrgA (UPF0299 family)
VIAGGDVVTSIGALAGVGVVAMVTAAFVVGVVVQWVAERKRERAKKARRRYESRT